MATVAAEPRVGTSLRSSTKTRMPVLVAIAFIVAIGILVLVLFGQWLTPYSPTAQNLALSSTGPNHAHWLGTDSLGRDVLSLIIAGSRVAVVGPLVIALGCVLFGASLGILAGFKGGVLDAAINRFADLLFALPGLVIIIVIVGVIGGGYWFAVFVLMALSVPVEIRLVRSAASVVARLPYIEAARTIDISNTRIMFRHVLPNVLPTIIATFLLDLVGALISLSSLAYLGLGVPPGTADWGSLLQEGQNLLYTNPWLSIAPGLMIVLTATSLTLIGDWVYDRYSLRGDQP